MHTDHALVALAMDGSLKSSLRMLWPRVWIAASAEFSWLPRKLRQMVKHLFDAACAAALRSLDPVPGPPGPPGMMPFRAAAVAPTSPKAPNGVEGVSVSPTWPSWKSSLAVG